MAITPTMRFIGTPGHTVDHPRTNNSFTAIKIPYAISNTPQRTPSFHTFYNQGLDILLFFFLLLCILYLPFDHLLNKIFYFFPIHDYHFFITFFSHYLTPRFDTTIRKSPTKIWKNTHQKLFMQQSKYSYCHLRVGSS